MSKEQNLTKVKSLTSGLQNLLEKMKQESENLNSNENLIVYTYNIKKLKTTTVNANEEEIIVSGEDSEVDF